MIREALLEDGEKVVWACKECMHISEVEEVGIDVKMPCPTCGKHTVHTRALKVKSSAEAVEITDEELVAFISKKKAA